MKRSMMRSALVITEKEIIQMTRSKRQMALLLGVPLMFLIFGIIGVTIAEVSTSQQQNQLVPVWYINKSPSQETGLIINEWDKIEGVQLIDRSNSSLDTLLNDTEMRLVAYFPSNFTPLFRLNQTATIYIYYYKGDFEAEQVANQLVVAVSTINLEIVIRENPNLNLIRILPVIEPVETRKEGLPPALASIISILPLYLVLILVIPPLSLILISVTIEREQRTLESLLVQPIERTSLFLGKILYGWFVIAVYLGANLGAVSITGIYAFFVLSPSSESEFTGFLRTIVNQLKGPLLAEFLVGILVFLVLSALMLNLAVFLSLLAKDEREANLIFGLTTVFPVMLTIPIVAVGTSETIPSFVYAIMAFLPMLGIVLGFQFMLLYGHIHFVTILGLFTHIYYVLAILKSTASLSEDESFLEIKWTKAFRYLFRSLLLWK